MIKYFPEHNDPKYAMAANKMAAVGGTANAITLTPVIPVISYATAIGTQIMFTASGTNTVSPPTIAISGLAALNTTMGPVAVPIGGIISGDIYIALIESATSIRVTPFDAVSTHGDLISGPILISFDNTTVAQHFQVGGTSTANEVSVRAIAVSTVLTGGAATTSLGGMQNQSTFTPTVAGTTIYGLINIPLLNSAVSAASIYGTFSRTDLGASALGSTITVGAGFYAAAPAINAAATTNITSYYQFNASSVTQGALQTITNVYAFRGAQAAGTGRWNCAMAGTADNHFVGNMRIGSTAVPAAKLHITAGSATAGTAPIALTSGAVNTTAVAGQIEYDNNWWMTDSGAVRRRIAGTNYTTAESAITPPASLTAYQNATGYAADVLITGGTVTLIEFSRDGTNWYTVGAAVSGMFCLSPLDRVRVTYTVAPTMTLIPR